MTTIVEKDPVPARDGAVLGSQAVQDGLPFKDPVCGMDVEPGHEAARFDHRGRTYLFCNPGCCDQFAKNPAAYVGVQETGSTETKKPWWKFGSKG